MTTITITTTIKKTRTRTMTMISMASSTTTRNSTLPTVTGGKLSHQDDHSSENVNKKNESAFFQT